MTAIESNSRAFLKCLVSKELLSFQRARFQRGDFVEFLKSNREQYDLVLASGVLYHMTDPLELLELMASSGRRLAIWTHYFDERIIMGSELARQFQLEPEPVSVGDVTYILHPREYLEALSYEGFCGGPETYARWMERDDLLDALRALGFDQVEVSHDHRDHKHGPSLLLLAERSS